MKAVLLSLVLILLPNVALSNPSSFLDPRTQAILEQRFCQYLKSGWTPREAIEVIRYQVERNLPAISRFRRETGSMAQLGDLVADQLVGTYTVAVLRNALENRCPEFLRD